MAIPTEPIGSIPRPQPLLDGMAGFAAGTINRQELDDLRESALKDTISRFEQTGSPVITDGEQSKPSFITYPIDGLAALAPDGVADAYLNKAKTFTTHPVKQAVIAPSAVSLIYPGDGLPGYPREKFIADLVDQSAADIRRCLDAGAAAVQLDFTEGRLSVKLDPSKGLLQQFVELNNQVLDRFTEQERQLIGVHT
ncbi:MAG TPA: hypothetical protein VGH27_35945 [Streptosporangiaceae bacterium]|jgi:5-methyltetrahydropteroyltriglutamate--homocysteine methyltransferase